MLMPKVIAWSFENGQLFFSWVSLLFTICFSFVNMAFSLFCRRRFSSFLCLNKKKGISFTAALDSETTQLGTLPFRQLLLTVRSFSSNPSDKLENNIDRRSFTISYLVNSCGLSSDSAKSISNYVLLDNRNNPDSLLRLLRSHDFSDGQISEVVRKNPRVLRSDTDKIISPKLQFLRSIGLSSNDLSTLMTKNPTFLGRSLNHYLIPFYDILKCSLSDHDVVTAFKRLSLRSLCNLNYLNANLSALREIGVLPSTISLLLKTHPGVICHGTEKFNQAVAEVLEMGFNPVLYTFAVALKAKVDLSERTWKLKIEAFEKWGISEDEFIAAFRKHPQCMILSEESIHNKMNFLVREMGWQPDEVLKQPLVICRSLEGRIMPRCWIIKILLCKGLIKKKISLLSIIYPSDKQFLDKYVTNNIKQVPKLLEVFEGKTGPEDLDVGFDEKHSASQVQHSGD